jgi:hypothetical protein
MPATGSTTGVPMIPSGLTLPQENPVLGMGTGVPTFRCHTMAPVPAFNAVMVSLISATMSRFPT